MATSGRTIEVEYTGLRPGEKLHEDLFGADESPRMSAHPLIRSVDVPPLGPDVLSRLETADRSEDDLRAALAREVTADAHDVDRELRRLSE